MGLENLPVDCREAQLRIQHPDYSIQRLADSLSIPLPKVVCQPQTQKNKQDRR